MTTAFFLLEFMYRGVIVIYCNIRSFMNVRTLGMIITEHIIFKLQHIQQYTCTLLLSYS